MKKVVILARVSTDKQEYERQITELAEHCRKMDWEVVRIFANKVSGAKTNEEREEIQELIEFVKTHQIQRVVCLKLVVWDETLWRHSKSSNSSTNTK